MKTIPISGAAGACDEPSGEILRLDILLTRRGFLKGSAILMGTTATTSVLFALAPSRAWTLALMTLTQDEGATLLHMGRVLYLHDKLPDAVYALLVKDLDTAASTDAALGGQLRTGIQELNRLAGGEFFSADERMKLEAVTAMAKSDFFGTYTVRHAEADK